MSVSAASSTARRDGLGVLRVRSTAVGPAGAQSLLAAAIGERLPRERRYHPVVAFDRIAVDHRIMGGVPCVKGSRIPVATVVGMVAEGLTIHEIRSEFPQLTTEDVQASLRYAAAAVDERELPLRTAG